MNMEAIERLRAWLLDESKAQKFNMNYFRYDGHNESGQIKENDPNWCGTTCCMAGALMCIYNPGAGYHDDYVSHGASVLGVSYDTASELFYVEDKDNVDWWPDKSLDEVTAEEALIALDNLAEHGEPRWPEILG